MGEHYLQTKVIDKMAFMKRDVNLGLVLLIIATLLLFTGFTVFYQNNFKQVISDYNDKYSQLKKVTQELENEKGRLNKTYELRVKAESDIQALDSQYKSLSEERDALEAHKNAIQSELSTTKTQLAVTKAELGQAQEQLTAAQSQVATVTTSLNSCKSQRDNYKQDLEDCQASLG